MKIIESKAELLQQPSGLEGVFHQIEACGRTCYKTSDQMVEGESSRPFVERMIASHHTAMLEHGTVYLKIPYNFIHRLLHPGLCSKYFENPYTRVNVVWELCTSDGVELHLDVKAPHYTPYLAITTNYRVIVENHWEDDLKYLCEPTEFHERRITFRLTTDTGVSHELVRHRVFSFAQESTRYCNYSKDRFGKELTFILPSWITRKQYKDYCKNYSVEETGVAADRPPEESPDMQLYQLFSYFAYAEEGYFKMLDLGWKPQQARQLLPKGLKTEICMTGFTSDWKFFFDLRLWGKTGKPHPDMERLAAKMWKELANAGIQDSVSKHQSKFEEEPSK